MVRVAGGGQRGKAGRKGNEKTGETIVSRGMPSAASGEPMAQVRAVRKDGWTMRRRAKFLDVLRATSNVQEAARAVRMNKGGAYDLRRRDPAFAAQWKEALEEGYAELEMHLLRQAMFGSETTETVDDGKEGGGRKTKTVHSYPHLVALRLLLAHKSAVQEYRQEQGIERPGSEAVRAEIREKLAQVRDRSGGGGDGHGEGDADGEGSGDA